MVYETIKLYSEKFTTNNSENKQELSYTPKLPNHPTAHLPGEDQSLQPLTAKLFKR